MYTQTTNPVHAMITRFTQDYLKQWEAELFKNRYQKEVVKGGIFALRKYLKDLHYNKHWDHWCGVSDPSNSNPRVVGAISALGMLKLRFEANFKVSL